MEELKLIIGRRKVLDSCYFESLWLLHVGKDAPPITGDLSYNSYVFLGGYKGHKAIIKGIWGGRGEEEVIHEGFYLNVMGMLLTFVINPDPSPDDLPKYIFIIKDVGYVLKTGAITNDKKDQLNQLNAEAKRKIESTFSPTPSL